MKTSKKACAGDFTAETLNRAAKMLRLLAHTDRLAIVATLKEGDALPVHSIMQRLNLPQSATSQHLNRMRRAGLIQAERRGKEVWYRIADRRCLSLLECIRTEGGKREKRS